MSEDDVLPDDLRSDLVRIGRTDILVGIPCFNSARTVGHVVTAVEIGLRKHFPDLRAVILVSDGGSTDRTIETAMAAGVGDRAETYLLDPRSPVPHKTACVYRGLPGKGSAFRAIFESARATGASACAVVDSDLRSITPAWLDGLLTPVVRHGYEFVAPLYARHRFDGTITNSIAYPLTTALYGTRLRQPIGGDFGFTGDLAVRYADANVWETDVARFGVDVWMTTVALVEGRRVCQTSLGAKLHDPKDPGADLGPMFRQVVGSLFALAGKYPERWMGVKEVTDPPTFGLPASFSVEPIAVSIDRLLAGFEGGFTRYEDVWRSVLSEESFDTVERLHHELLTEGRGADLSIDTWIAIVFDFLLAYNTRREDPETLPDALIPLYFARTAAFVREVGELTDDEADTVVDRAVEDALRQKPALERRWREERVPEHVLAEQPVVDGRPLGEVSPETA